MLYKQFNISSDGHRLTYITERDPLISETEAQELCERLALCEYLDMCGDDVDEIEDLLGIEMKSTSSDISEDEFSYRLLGGNYQLVDSWRSFGNRINDIFINVYLEYDSNVIDEPVCYCFEAQCGQTQDVDTIGIVDKGHPREQVFEDAWRDLLYQMRRYFKVTGWLLKSGIFRIYKMTSEDYEAMREEREMILV